MGILSIKLPFLLYKLYNSLLKLLEFIGSIFSIITRFNCSILLIKLTVLINLYINFIFSFVSGLLLLLFLLLKSYSSKTFILFNKLKKVSAIISSK